MNVKRIFDLVFAIPGLIILLPLFAVIAVWIKLDTSGPVFYRQERVGKGGNVFKIFKFRTMVVDADVIGRTITVGDDPRITWSGKVLRKFKLDELPQLINVIKGQMSLVGPRPEVLRYVNMYTTEQQAVLELIPGITDPASIKYRNENELLAAAAEEDGMRADPEYVYVHEIMPDKIRMNLEYAASANLLSDFAVIIRTLFGR